MITIEAINLRKTYKLYQSPAHRLKEILFRKSFHKEFVALEDISFSVLKGEIFGIIGENGAGKSTLLKLLAKTLKPSSGRLSINGRTSALLELGAGFNPELTGEENIYLNAYLLGLSKNEITEKKQEIIDFSELGDFIKRPVKTYSSGMHVRLAFSIATSVDPDILIIDEALSVGDQHFQKKCVDRMMDFKKRNKTILFCSHSLYFVQELCGQALWLQNGRIAKAGNCSGVINAYNDWVREKDAGMKAQVQNAAPTDGNEKQKSVWFEKTWIADGEGRKLQTVRTGQDIWLDMLIGIAKGQLEHNGHIGIGLERNDKEPIFGVTTKIDGLSAISFYDGQRVRLKLPSLKLLPGQYYIVAALMDENAVHLYDMQLTEMFMMEDFKGEFGIVKLEHQWELTPEACQ